MKKIIIVPMLISAKTDFEYHLDKPTHLYVGTPFRLNVSFKTGLNDSIFSPKIDTLDIFVLRNIKQHEQVEGDVKTTTVNLEFAPFDTGTYDFPEIEFMVKSKTDSTKIFKTPVYKMTVEAVTADTTKSIRDIKGPVKLKFSFWEIALPIILLIGLIALIIYLIKRKPNKEGGVKKKKKEIPVYVRALNLLKELDKKKLLENGNYLDYFFELSYILRYFLEGYYKINAVEMTTNEIKEALGKVENRSQIMALLNYADKVKFAKFVPTTQDGKKFENWLKEYLYSIKEKEEKRILENTGEK